MNAILDASIPYAVPVFTLGGVKYCSVPGEERFNEASTTPDLDTSITALQVMKNVLPDITKSRYTKPQPPDPFFLVGLSSRRKIMRAFQLWYDPPPITEATSEFVPFFEHLSTGVPNRWEVQQEYGACRWATKYDDNELATSLLLHYGYAPDYKIPMGGNSIHRLIPTTSGVTLDIEYVHTFQDRLDAACAAIEQDVYDRRIKNKPLTTEEIITAGMMAFSYHQKRYCSIDKEYRMCVTNKLTAYIENYINALETGLPPRPEIHEPEDMLADQTHDIEFSKFVVPDGVSQLQYDQRKHNGVQKTLDALEIHFANIPRGVEITRKDYLKTLNTRLITSAKNKGFLHKVRHGVYMIPE